MKYLPFFILFFSSFVQAQFAQEYTRSEIDQVGQSESNFLSWAASQELKTERIDGCNVYSYVRNYTRKYFVVKEGICISHSFTPRDSKKTIKKLNKDFEFKSKNGSVELWDGTKLSVELFSDDNGNKMLTFRSKNSIS